MRTGKPRSPDGAEGGKTVREGERGGNGAGGGGSTVAVLVTVSVRGGGSVGFTSSQVEVGCGAVAAGGESGDRWPKLAPT